MKASEEAKGHTKKSKTSISPRTKDGKSSSSSKESKSSSPRAASSKNVKDGVIEEKKSKVKLDKAKRHSKTVQLGSPLKQETKKKSSNVIGSNQTTDNLKTNSSKVQIVTTTTTTTFDSTAQSKPHILRKRAKAERNSIAVEKLSSLLVIEGGLKTEDLVLTNPYKKETLSHSGQATLPASKATNDRPESQLASLKNKYGTNRKNMMMSGDKSIPATNNKEIIKKVRRKLFDADNPESVHFDDIDDSQLLEIIAIIKKENKTELESYKAKVSTLTRRNDLLTKKEKQLQQDKTIFDSDTNIPVVIPVPEKLPFNINPATPPILTPHSDSEKQVEVKPAVNIPIINPLSMSKPEPPSLINGFSSSQKSFASPVPLIYSQVEGHFNVVDVDERYGLVVDLVEARNITITEKLKLRLEQKLDEYASTSLVNNSEGQSVLPFLVCNVTYLDQTLTCGCLGYLAPPREELTTPRSTSPLMSLSNQTLTTLNSTSRGGSISPTSRSQILLQRFKLFAKFRESFKLPYPKQSSLKSPKIKIQISDRLSGEIISKFDIPISALPKPPVESYEKWFSMSGIPLSNSSGSTEGAMFIRIEIRENKPEEKQKEIHTEMHRIQRFLDLEYRDLERLKGRRGTVMGSEEAADWSLTKIKDLESRKTKLEIMLFEVGGDSQIELNRPDGGKNKEELKQKIECLSKEIEEEETERATMQAYRQSFAGDVKKENFYEEMVNNCTSKMDELFQKKNQLEEELRKC
eukprot:TRINITY_DN11675_c0_g1_i1.p1 TRINITY_DN11675_c0_g1~~TRINITY_DN11675_c0_g1_i1.p1  ORF type:complete len:748 (-),score=155.37 TRINITY_DN11675_c0_g1_i1:13-2256(-)